MWQKPRGATHRQAATRRPRAAAAADVPSCARCGQPEPICICADITPLEHRIAVLILQHPQEQKEVLSTARLASLSLAQATFKVGLSWRSLGHALGHPAEGRRWAVLYLGSAKAEDLAKGAELVLLDGKRKPIADQAAAQKAIEGIILLDGTWSQAKTLWWRNAWMLKCRSLVLGPQQQSRYGKLRREPRRDALSTLEAAALALARLEKRPEIETELNAHFEKMLARYNTAEKSA
jgi:hypothetical protein